MFNYFFFYKILSLWDNVEKYCRAGQARDDNMAHAHCMLESQGYKHTLEICNAYIFSSATMVEWTASKLRYNILPVLLNKAISK